MRLTRAWFRFRVFYSFIYLTALRGLLGYLNAVLVTWRTEGKYNMKGKTVAESVVYNNR